MNPRLGPIAVAILLASGAAPSDAQNIDNDPCPGSLEQCDDAGVAADRAGNFHLAAKLFETACSRGFKNSCANLAEYYFDGRARRRDTKAAAALFSDACDARILSGCAGECIVDFATYNNLLPHYHRVCSQDVQAACTGGNPWMCSKLPLLPSALRPQRRFVLERRCNEGDADACGILGTALYSVGNFGGAFTMTKRSCDLGAPVACSNLGELYYAGEGAPEDLDLAAALFSNACDAGVTSGCAGYCLVLAEDPAVWRGRTIERCLKHLALSCEDENFWMCRQLRQLDTKSAMAEPHPLDVEPYRDASGCPPSDVARIQQETVRLAALAGQGRFDEAISQAKQFVASLPLACQETPRGPTPIAPKGITPTQMNKMNQQMQEMERIRQMEHQNFKEDLYRQAIEGGITPPPMP